MQSNAGVELIDFAAFLRELCADLHRSLMGESEYEWMLAAVATAPADGAEPLVRLYREEIRPFLTNEDARKRMTSRLSDRARAAQPDQARTRTRRSPSANSGRRLA